MNRPNMQSFFPGGVQYVDGIGYVQGGLGSAHGALHGEADIAMISGLGALGDGGGLSTSTSASGSINSAPLTEQLRFYFNRVPLWMWLGALGLGAAAVLLYLKYGKK